MDLDGEYNEAISVGPVVHTIVVIFVILGGILANWKFLQNMKEDDKNRGPNSNGILIRDVMETHSKIQMVYVPVHMILMWLTHENVVFPVWHYPSFCYVKFAAFLIFRIYVAFNSLVVACMRYTFVVHHDGVSSFGIEKAKRFFYYGSIITPLFIGIAWECVHNITTTPRGRAYSTCILSYRNSSNTADFNANLEQNFSLPVYLFVHQYISANVTYYIDMFLKICLWIIFANLIEGVLYCKTFSYIRR